MRNSITYRNWAAYFGRLNVTVLSAFIVGFFLYALVFRLFRAQFQDTLVVKLAFVEYSLVLALLANSICFGGVLLERWLSPAKVGHFRKMFFWMALAITIPLILAMPCLSALFAGIHLEAY
jgi:hypothetical protein